MPEGKTPEQIIKDREEAERKEKEAVYYSWWSPLSAEEREEKLIGACKDRELLLREELDADPGSWKLQAKLAISLLETNGSRIIPQPDRLQEGRQLAEAAFIAKPDNWRTMIAKTRLFLADTANVKSEEASNLAMQAVQARQNRFTNAAAGIALAVDGCALVCSARRSAHRIALDPEGAVYPEGKEPSKMLQAYMKAALERLTKAGKHLHSAIDSELFERDNKTYGPDADPKVAERLFVQEMAHHLPLLSLEQYKNGIHYEAMFAIGGCEDFVGRRFDGKVCPGKDPPSKAKKKKKGAPTKG